MDHGDTLNGDLGEVLRRRPVEVASLLDRTQGHLILRWNAWRAPEALRRIGLPSLGVGDFRPTDSLDDYVKRADRSLYDAKAAGRNRVGP